MTKRILTVLGYIPVAIFVIIFYGMPILGIFTLNHYAFIGDGDLTLDLGIIIVKHSVIKVLLIAFDIILLINLIAYIEKLIRKLLKKE